MGEGFKFLTMPHTHTRTCTAKTTQRTGKLSTSAFTGPSCNTAVQAYAEA
jgi:hypothetical protein